ncbi:MAG: C40 family peptidase [Aquaticitalea sp.]
MRTILVIFCLALCLSGCKSSQSAKSSTSKRIITNKSNRSPYPNAQLADKIIHDAVKYEGVRYKYGGTTKSGMDCSGLVTTAFASQDISLPRSSSQMAVTGDWIDLKEVEKGDLLFFATSRNSRTVNHVGIVTFVGNDRVNFIHASTSAGVITSSLAEKYWYFAFVQARRVL